MCIIIFGICYMGFLVEFFFMNCKGCYFCFWRGGIRGFNLVFFGGGGMLK